MKLFDPNPTVEVVMVRGLILVAILCAGNPDILDAIIGLIQRSFGG